MINLRKLVALDMLLHGKRFIFGELAIGVLLPLILGLSFLRGGLFGQVQPVWETILGFWLVGIAVNYIPLFVYAVLIARSGTIEEEGQPEMARVKIYSIQQVVIFVPFLVAILALLQEGRRVEK